MAYGVLNAVRHKADPANGILSPAGIAALFDPQIKIILDAINAEITDCWNNADANIETKLDKELLEKLDVSDHAVAAATLLEQLAAKWYWKDLTIIVYDPVTTYGSHGVIGGQHRLDRFRQQCLDNSTANIIVTWCDRIKTPIPADEGEKVYSMISENIPVLINEGLFGHMHFDSHKHLVASTGLVSAEIYNKELAQQAIPGVRSALPQIDTRGYLDAFEKLGPGYSLLSSSRADVIGSTHRPAQNA